MKKWIRRILMLALFLICAGSVGTIAFVQWQYKANEALYDEASNQFTSTQKNAQEPKGDVAPIVIDFDALQEANPDVIGWIYCEGTVIDYPIMRGEDNDFYLHHAYDKSYSVAGSIFMDYTNGANFEDSNTILYGHHMKDKSMFATLEYWADQAYYEEHPQMWLLTPTQDFRIELFSGYTTSARSEAYMMYPEPCEELNTYLSQAAAKSNFQADVELDGNSHYVILSTCAYVFDNARYVVHGKLVPADSAGGTPLAVK